MTVPGQRLLQANEPTSDDNDESDGDDTVVVVGETWCSESEGMLSESESESDDSECQLVPSPAKKRCSTRSGRSATCFALNW